MKIRKYQVGSIIYTPTPTAAATASAQQSASSSSASKDTPEKITGTIQKEIMDLMKTDGLPSDVDALLTYASKYLDKSSRLSDMSLFGGTDSDYDIKDYIKILRQVQEAKFNNGEFKKASENLEKEGAWGNAAIDSTGNLFVQDEKGQLGKVTLRKYIDNRDKYHAVTNGELMEMRARQKGLAFDQIGILTNMQEAAGMKSITDQLRKIMGDFKQKKIQYYKFSKGTDRITDKSGKTYNMQELDDGMEMLTKGGPSGYYKMTNATNVPSVKRAVMYLWNSLDDSMQNTIKAQIATSGDDPDNAGIVNFLENIIWAGTNEEQSADFDSAATNYDPNGTGKKGGSGKETLSGHDTYQIAFANGEGRDTFVDLTPKASKIYETGTMRARAIGFGPMAYVKDTRITLGEHMNLPEFFQKSALASSLQLDSITFGNRLLENWELPAIMYEGGQQTYSVYLPYKEINGKITPDFELFEKYNKYLKAVKDNPNMPDMEKRSLLQELQLTGANIDTSDLNNIKIKNTKRFLTFAAVAGKDTIELKSIENFLGKLDRDQGKLFKVPYNNALKYNSTTPQKNVKATNKQFTEATAGDFYEGNVYIPVDQYAAYRTSSEEPVTKESLTDIDRKIKANDMMNAVRDYTAETDPNYEDNLNIGQFKDF